MANISTVYGSIASSSQVIAFTYTNDGALVQTGELASSGGSGPSHISVHPSNRFVLTSNYGSGHVATIEIYPNGTLNPTLADIKSSQITLDSLSSARV